jgi:hypothetical protein
MTLRPDFTEATLEEDLGEIALRALREWLCSENYRDRERWRKVWEETSLFKKEQDEWNSTQGMKRGWALGRTVLDYWLAKGWVKGESPRLGAPRRVEHSHEVISAAWKVYGDGCQGFTSDATWQWAESILGERTNHNSYWVLVITAKVYDEVFSRLDPEELEGLTREETAELLDLPKKFANSFVRHLVENHDWEIATTKVERSTRRVLRRTTQ